MKLHEFVCRDCGKEFEELVQDSSQIQCPECNGHNTKKLLSAVKTPQSETSSEAGSSACAPNSGFA